MEIKIGFIKVFFFIVMDKKLRRGNRKFIFCRLRKISKEFFKENVKLYILHRGVTKSITVNPLI